MQNPTLKNTSVTSTPNVPKSTSWFITLLLFSLANLYWLTWCVLTELFNSIQATHRARGEYSSLTYRHEENAIILQQSKLFISLLKDIWSHLLNSKTTRAVYVSMAKQFRHALQADVQNMFAEPTDQQFYDYIFSNWPTFSSFKAITPNRVTWRRVVKGNLEPNEVNILSSIVESADSTAAMACDLQRLPINLYKLVLTTIILHELSHAFTKFYFNEIITPLGVGHGDTRYGESGWLVEEEIMGGRIGVEWVDGSKFGEMDAIDRVILINGSESWVVDVDAATKIILSLQGPTLDSPVKATLSSHDQPIGSARARVTEPTDNPVPKTEMATVGLGITYTPQAGPVISFVGCDR